MLSYTFKNSHSQVSDPSCFIKCTTDSFEVEFILAYIADAQAVLSVYCLHMSQITFCHIVGHISLGFFYLWLLAMLTHKCVVDANSKHSLFLYIETENKIISAH